MQPYKRKRHHQRDMITLGGWLFADLLLGLSMLFLVANTVGAPPPEPTPTPLPNFLATIDANQQAADETVVALQGELTVAQNDARATAEAQSTRSAMSASARSTADAEATGQAVISRATIEALSTEQARSQTDQAQLNADLATNQAIIDAQATQQADLSAQSADELATSEAAALAAQNRLSTIQASTTDSEAQIATLQAESVDYANALATATAESAAAQQEATSAEATSAAASSQILQAQQAAQANSLNPTGETKVIQVDMQGVLAEEPQAIRGAEDALDQVLAEYKGNAACSIGFVLISSRAPDLGTGVQLSSRIATMIEDTQQDLLQPADNGDPGELASESIALPGTTPYGEVEMLLFMTSGCGQETALQSPLITETRRW